MEYWIVKLDEVLFRGMEEIRVVVFHCVAPYLDSPPTSADPTVEENRIYYDPLRSQLIDVSTLICKVRVNIM